MKARGIDPGNILLDKKIYRNILIQEISCKPFISSKPFIAYLVQ